MILGKYGELEWYWIISSSSMMHWNPASEKSTSPSPGFKRCLLVLDFSLNFGNLTFTSNFDLLINMPEITENTPPSLLAQLSVLALQPYASLTGVLALMIILAIFKAVFDQDEKLIPGYAAVGVFKDDTPLQAKHSYAENSRAILQEGLKKASSPK